jgi:AraC-like DNA-binding protein
VNVSEVSIHGAVALSSSCVRANEENVAISVPGPPPPPAWSPTARRLVQSARSPRPRPSTWTLAYDQYWASVETRTDPLSYSWDGLNRGGDPLRPHFIFQLTLAGFGELELPGKEPEALAAGTAFFALVPSRHRYYLPERSPGWTFGWLDVHHPYVVERVARHVSSHGAIVRLSPNDPFTIIAVRLIDRLLRKDFRDQFELESALFEFTVANDRRAYYAAYPQRERERLLEETRDAILADLRRPVRVDALAAHRGMTRSHFSHYFKARTGLSPAAFASRIRIQEAARLLLSTQRAVKEIADAVGFANVNHFCKVFRRQQHTSPNIYRRQGGRLVG